MNSELWDAEEFEFFNSLSDEDKLMYLYDVNLGDFADELEDVDFDMDDDPPPSANANPVNTPHVKKITIYDQDRAKVEASVWNAIMSGFVALNIVRSTTNNSAQTTFDVVGIAPPISVN